MYMTSKPETGRNRSISQGLAGTIFVAALVSGAAYADAQKRSDQANLIMVRGCLHGRTLTTFEGTDQGLTPQRFQITGNREILAVLKEHSGHVEEVTGVLKAGKGNGSVRLAEKPINKGRIYIGAGTRTSAAESPAYASTIELRQLTHVQDRCP